MLGSCSLNPEVCCAYVMKGQLTPIYLPKGEDTWGTSTGWEFNHRATLMLKSGSAL